MTAKAKRIRCIELRKEGYTFAEIAAEVGYDNATAAYRALKTGLTEIIREPVEELVTQEIDRLDTLFRVQYAFALQGDSRATEMCLKIMDRKAKYLGLDHAAKISVTHEMDPALVAQLAEQYGLSSKEIIAEAEFHLLEQRRAIQA